MLQQLLEGGYHLVVAAPAHGPQCLEVEGAADHRRSRGNLSGDVAQPGESRLQNVGHVNRPRPPFPDRRQVLDDEEGEPLGLGEDDIHHPWVDPITEHRCCEVPHRRRVKSVESYQNAIALAVCSAHHPPQPRGQGELFCSPGDNECHAKPVEPPYQIGEKFD